MLIVGIAERTVRQSPCVQETHIYVPIGFSAFKRPSSSFAEDEFVDTIGEIQDQVIDQTSPLCLSSIASNVHTALKTYYTQFDCDCKFFFEESLIISEEMSALIELNYESPSPFILRVISECDSVFLNHNSTLTKQGLRPGVALKTLMLENAKINGLELPDCHNLLNDVVKLFLKYRIRLETKAASELSMFHVSHGKI